VRQETSHAKRDKSPNTLGTSKSATEIVSPSDSQVRKRQQDNMSSINKVEGGFILNDSKLMVFDKPSSNEELRRKNLNDADSLAGKTSHTMMVSQIPTHINQGGNFNVNSESETQQDIGERNY
jgi:hypothetical protein